MRIAEKFGQMSARADISSKVLIELTRAPDPQAALEEAVARKDSGETVTVADAKEMVRRARD